MPLSANVLKKCFLNIIDSIEAKASRVIILKFSLSYLFYAIARQYQRVVAVVTSTIFIWSSANVQCLLGTSLQLTVMLFSLCTAIS